MTKTTTGRPASRKPRKTFTPKTQEQKDAELSELKDMLAEGVLKTLDSESWKTWLTAASKFHKYSFNNVMLAHLQCEMRGMKPPTRLAGYNTWKSVGRQVSRGQKGLAIFAPIIVALRPGDEGYVEGEKKSRLVGFRVTRTFDYQQTEGDPLPERSEVIYPNGDVPLGMWTALVDFAGSKGHPVTVEKIKGGAQGFTDPKAKRIAISDDLGSEARESMTLIHEIAHMLLHSDITDYHGHRGTYETEAESVAFVVGSYFGIDVGTESFDYVAGWAPDFETLSKVGARIMKTANAVIDAVEACIGGKDEDESAEDL